MSAKLLPGDTYVLRNKSISARLGSGRISKRPGMYLRILAFSVTTGLRTEWTPKKGEAVKMSACAAKSVVRFAMREDRRCPFNEANFELVPVRP